MKGIKNFISIGSTQVIPVVLTTVLHLFIITGGWIEIPTEPSPDRRSEQAQNKPELPGSHGNTGAAASQRKRSLDSTFSERDRSAAPPVAMVHWRQKEEQPSYIPTSQNSFSLPPLELLFQPSAPKLVLDPSKKGREQLLPPSFSPGTIPQKPVKELQAEVDETNLQYIQGDIFNDVIPLGEEQEHLSVLENRFRKEVRSDILDGKLDMPFSRFIIAAEYFSLARILAPTGWRPSFTLEQAYELYQKRLRRMQLGKPRTFSGQSIVLLLQQYAENKFYPALGSGMILESLFHNLNDCEGGSKEVLAYLDDLYPDLKIGTNRGLLQTTSGSLVGHMQAYIYPSNKAWQIIDNDNGVVLETTKVGYGAITAHKRGTVFPLEDFVAAYYPDLIKGTPLETISKTGVTSSATGKKTVGVGNPLLKMSYSAGNDLLSEEAYDLAGMRADKLENRFEQSGVPGCDPEVNPANIHQRNLFSNFVLISPSLRKKLVEHYLAGLAYWDNRVMPQWKAFDFLPTYDNLIGTLLDASEESGREVVVDGINAVPLSQLQSHTGFIKRILAESKINNNNAEKKREGGREALCRSFSTLDTSLLTYLFREPQAPGVYFLPSPAADLSWTDFTANVLDDCLAMPTLDKNRALVEKLEQEAREQGSSLRNELYHQALNRALLPSELAEEFTLRKLQLRLIFTGVAASEKTTSAQPMAQGESSARTTKGISGSESLRLQGRAGIENRLLRDSFDFFSREEFLFLVESYVTRPDLSVSLAGANNLLQHALFLVKEAGWSDRFIKALAARYSSCPNHNMKMALGRVLLENDRLSQSEAEQEAILYLKNQQLRPDIVVELINYGLSPVKATQFNRIRVADTLNQLRSIAAEKEKGADQAILYRDLIELFRTCDFLQDRQGQKSLLAELEQSVLNDFAVAGSDGEQVFDYGKLFNKLYTLAVMQKGAALEQGLTDIEANQFLKTYLQFTRGNPVGKLMASLVVKIVSPADVTRQLRPLIAEQFDTILKVDRRFKEEQKNGTANLKAMLIQLSRLVQTANAISYILNHLSQAESESPAVPGRKDSGTSIPESPLGYLRSIHLALAQTDLFSKALGGRENEGNAQKENILSIFDGHFYLQESVSESFALLGALALAKQKEHTVHFRKIDSFQETIKKLEKMKVFAGSSSRILTRQDISLLTLLLNPENTPQKVSEVYGGIIDTTEKILNLEGLSQREKEYFFAPHFPYLSSSDSGFLYSPETVADLKNAHKWGPKNEIIFTSYLYCKNLPETLPDWLLKAAIWRSEYERKRLAYFERNTFVSMIQECENDFTTVPRGLFNAKWRLRKPFGEDALPGTLLLLRTGYLKIIPGGEIVETEKCRAFKRQLIKAAVHTPPMPQRLLYLAEVQW